MFVDASTHASEEMCLLILVSEQRLHPQKSNHASKSSANQFYPFTFNQK